MAAALCADLSGLELLLMDVPLLHNGVCHAYPCAETVWLELSVELCLRGRVVEKIWAGVT